RRWAPPDEICCTTRANGARRVAPDGACRSQPIQYEAGMGMGRVSFGFVAAAAVAIQGGNARAGDPAGSQPTPTGAGPPLPTHETVLGPEIAGVTLERVGANETPRNVAWRELTNSTLDSAVYTLRFRTPAGSDAVEIPVCAGRVRVTANTAANRSSGPLA